MKFYDDMSPTQKYWFQNAVLFTLAIASAVVNQKMGERRGYKRGYADGVGPAKKEELTACYVKGQADGRAAGYHKGAWASQPEAFQAGISFGAASLRQAHPAYDPFRRPPSTTILMEDSIPA